MRSDLARAYQTFQRGKAHGPRSLLTAVFGQAALDLAGGDPAAARYFLSDIYRHHLQLAGLPADYLPAGVNAVELLRLKEKQNENATG